MWGNYGTVNVLKRRAKIVNKKNELIQFFECLFWVKFDKNPITPLAIVHLMTT